MRVIWVIFAVTVLSCEGFYCAYRKLCKETRLKAVLNQPFLFAGVNLRDPLATSMRQLNISSPSPIQRASLVTLNSGASCILHAHTGSGKTVAYLLPILKRIYDTTKVPFKSLVVVPTRELAVQVAADVESLCGDSSMVHVCLETSVSNIVAPIVVGTPFRLLDALKGESMDRSRINKAMQDLEYLVLDEVDRMIPIPGKYALLTEKRKLLEHSNPCIELIRFIVRHKEIQLLHLNRDLRTYQWEKDLPIQVVAASATVGRSLLRELNKLFYSYQINPSSTGEDQEQELVLPGSRGSLTIIRPETAVPTSAFHRSAVVRATNAPFIRSNESTAKANEQEALLSRSIGVPQSIHHVALLKPPVDPDDHAEQHRDKTQLNLQYLALLKDYWIYQKEVSSSPRRGLLFVPQQKDVTLAVQMFRRWGVKEAVDLQKALGLHRRETDETAINSGGMETSELIVRANKRGIGGGTGKESGGELFIAPESAARGLHLQDLNMVMIYQLPFAMDQYLHMAGRTGRLSSLRSALEGVLKDRDRVITLVDDFEYRRLISWQTPLGIKIDPIGEENAKLHLRATKWSR